MQQRLVLLSILVACGDQESASPDAAPSAPPRPITTVRTYTDSLSMDAAMPTCLAQASYATLGSASIASDHAGSGGGAHAHYQSLSAKLNDTDYFLMLMFAFDGPWAGSDLAPVVADFSTLDTLDPQIQLFPMAQFDATGVLTDDSYYNQSYIAFGGVVSFTAIGGASGTHLTGTITNLKLDHVIINPATGGLTDPMDHCSATIASAPFDTVLVAGSPAFQGEVSGSFEIQPPKIMRLENRHF
jgi:hypothetical protein